MCRRTMLLLCVLGVLTVIVSCRTESTDPSGGLHTAQKDKQLGPVLAKVNGEVITVEGFERILGSLPKQTRHRVQTKKEKLKRLEDMIEEMLLLKEAERLELDKDEEIHFKVERYRTRLMTEKLYKAVANERIQVSDDDIQKYYDENIDKFTQKEKVRARQILILVPPGAGPEKEAEAKAKAEEVLSLARKGDDFVSLVKKYSEGPTKSRAGDLGYFSNDRILPNYGKAAFSLEKPGDISDIIKSSFGFHIVQLIDKKPAKTIDLKNVRGRIVQKLESKQRIDVRQSLARNLRESAQVEIHDELLE